MLRVPARDARGDLRPTDVQVGFELLLVLAAEAEAVRSHRGLLVADLAGQPALIRGLVLPPHLPLARGVFQDNASQWGVWRKDQGAHQSWLTAMRRADTCNTVTVKHRITPSPLIT